VGFSFSSLNFLHALTRTILSLMYKYILPFVLLGFSLTCDAQTRTTHKCSGEVITRSAHVVKKTPRLLGNLTHIWGGNRGVRGATRFDRWSSNRKRTHRKFIAR